MINLDTNQKIGWMVAGMFIMYDILTGKPQHGWENFFQQLIVTLLEKNK